VAKKKAEPDAGLLINAAKAIGKAVGKVAAVSGAKPEPPAKLNQSEAASVKTGKLPKKNKQRLPRRQKKMQKKAQAKSSAPVSTKPSDNL